MGYQVLKYTDPRLYEYKPGNAHNFSSAASLAASISDVVGHNKDVKRKKKLNETYRQAIAKEVGDNSLLTDDQLPGAMGKIFGLKAADTFSEKNLAAQRERNKPYRQAIMSEFDLPDDSMIPEGKEADILSGLFQAKTDVNKQDILNKIKPPQSARQPAYSSLQNFRTEYTEVAARARAIKTDPGLSVTQKQAALDALKQTFFDSTADVLILDENKRTSIESSGLFDL